MDAYIVAGFRTAVGKAKKVDSDLFARMTWHQMLSNTW